MSASSWTADDVSEDNIKECFENFYMTPGCKECMCLERCNLVKNRIFYLLRAETQKQL